MHLFAGRYRSFRERAVRLFAVASPLLMAYAVVVTANHYQLDSIVGSILALAGLWVAEESEDPAVIAQFVEHGHSSVS